jgi:transposase
LSRCRLLQLLFNRRWDVPAAETGGVASASGDWPPPTAETASALTRSKTQFTRASRRPVMRIVGLDLGADHIEICELVDGKPVRASIRRIEDLARFLRSDSEPARIAFEACREGWHVHDLLQTWGHEPVMLDTTRIKEMGVGRHRRKNDKIDAEAIARALESGHYAKAHVLSPARRDLRKRLSIRSALVETRAKLVVTIRGLARAVGAKIGRGQPANFLENVEKAKLPEELQRDIRPLLEVLSRIQSQLEHVETELVATAKEDPIIGLLATAPGVALIVAATYVSVIDEARRFRNAQAVGSYIGLVPSEDTTGGPKKRKLGSISRAGNSMLRAMLVEAAWHILRAKDNDDPVYQWANHIAQKRGRKIAAVALARKLALVLYAMWRDNTVYEPVKQARASIRGIRRANQTDQLRAIALANSAAKFERRLPKGRRPSDSEATH